MKIVIVDASLAKKRESKNRELKNASEAQLKEGFETSFGIRMDVTCEDINKFVNASIRYAPERILYTTIRDFFNNTHTIAPTQYHQMVMELVGYSQKLREKKWDLQKQVKTASAEELKNIHW